MKPHPVCRRTKIVATVGPASREPDRLAELVAAGVNVFRLNMSHGDQAGHAENVARIRAAADRAGRSVAILADLCGPKIRVGKFLGGSVELAASERVTVTTRDVLGEKGVVPSQYPALARDVRTGDRILLDDGLMELRVESTDGTDVRTTVLNGGTLKDRKGMNLPGVAVSSPALTDKDRADAAFALAQGVDYLAMSFVRRPWDVTDLKGLISAAGHNTPVIAKIEKPEAMTCIDEIIAVSDGVMVARGDLGVEMAPETVPLIQRTLVEKCRRAGKPVIVATQMLESMITNPRPTRAEVSDVSTAVIGGADAVMLSAETASGAYPVRAVEMMDRVARQVEAWQAQEGFRRITINDEEAAKGEEITLRRAVARATALLSRDLGVRAVVVRTKGGTSAGVVSATRPSAPVVAMTMSDRVARRLALLWGVMPRVVEEGSFANPQAEARLQAAGLGMADEGETILLVSGFGKNEPTVAVLGM